MRARPGIGAALGLCLSGSAAALDLTLHAEAVQQGMRLPLDAVADFSGAAGLRALQLPERGRIGDRVVFTRAELGRLIVAADPRLAGALHWSGAQRVVVRRSGVALAPETYVGQARAYWLAHCTSGSGRFALQARGDYRSLGVPAGTRSMTFSCVADTGGVGRVRVDIAVDGQHYASAAIAFDVRCWRPALVLRDAGYARQHLRADMAEVETAEVGALPGAPLDDPAQLRGKRLRRDVAAGRPLTERDVETVPAVEAGSRVNVYARVRRVVVQTTAVARQDGVVGQRIQATAADGKTRITVEVIGENRAMVKDSRNP